MFDTPALSIDSLPPPIAACRKYSYLLCSFALRLIALGGVDGLASAEVCRTDCNAFKNIVFPFVIL